MPGAICGGLFGSLFWSSAGVNGVLSNVWPTIVETVFMVGDAMPAVMTFACTEYVPRFSGARTCHVSVYGVPIVTVGLNVSAVAPI